MKLKKFYKSDLPTNLLEEIDSTYKACLADMRMAVSNDMWSADQQKVQKKMIIPLLAKYRALLTLGVAQEKALMLTKKFSENSAHKFNKVVKLFSRLPNFRKQFSKIFRKQMATPGIWDNQFIKDDQDEMVIDITKCLWKETCDFFNYPEVCKIFCDNDWILFGDLKTMHLERAGTLGVGDQKCDFKFVFDKKTKSTKN
ncbi:MAG: hypothetical protein CSA05_03375 [Bacteroidia bacterium]|nr:MAG: hypothetical protein CSA05_03375 [Bacteroidia bacterium]